MRFYSPHECDDWLKGHGLSKPKATQSMPGLRKSFPKDVAGTYRWASWISKELTFGGPCLLWITEFDIFSSSENLHLYYTLRRAEHNDQLLSEAPGHSFLNYEQHVFASFLQLAMLNGWGGYVFGSYNYVSIFFSHDEYFDFYAGDSALIERIHAGLS